MKSTPATKLNPLLRSNEAKEFESALRRKVIGQEDAVIKVTEIYQMFMAGLNPPGRPVGNLLFLGPTGSGKTRTVEAIAEALFGDARACMKIDCGEFQHSHEIAKLIGSPPGYLGHRETAPLITQEALAHWHTEKVRLSIILLDEIEKASDALWRLLLGVLDKGTLTLGDNRRVDLSQCLIIMTSNLGSMEMANMTDGGLGFQPTPVEINDRMAAKLSDIATGAAKRKFDPEFMNRIDKIVVFNTLKQEHLRDILKIELGMIQQRIFMSSVSNQFVLTFSNKVKEYLLKEGFNAKYGARHLKRTLEKKLVFPLANLVSTSQIALGDVVRVDMEGDVITFTKKEASRSTPSSFAAAASSKKVTKVEREPSLDDVPASIDD